MSVRQGGVLGLVGWLVRRVMKGGPGVRVMMVRTHTSQTTHLLTHTCIHFSPPSLPHTVPAMWRWRPWGACWVPWGSAWRRCRRTGTACTGQ